MTAHLPLRPTPADVRSLLLSDGASVRAQFLEHFAVEIESLCDPLTRAFSAWRDLDDLAHGGKRHATVAAFAGVALNSILTSSQLLLAGMLIPAGNLMRQFGEATAMACLCSSVELDVFARFDRDPRGFPIHDSLGLMARKTARRVLNIDEKEWRAFTAITKFYDKFSHPTLLVVASQAMFTDPGGISFGGDFDPGKVEQYGIEWTRRRSAADVLHHALQVLHIRLNAGTA